MTLPRRRFIAIAAAAGASLLPGRAGAEAAVHAWRGTALGAAASLRLRHPDRRAAARLVAECLDEVERLERIFSLYRPDSALVALNRDGRLEAPPAELVALLSEARRFSELSAGAFDVTVQPLWRLYAEHFAKPDADPAGPRAEAVAGARALVDYRGVEVAAGGIALARPGMAVTLNGIAQGYITDRVADLLRRAGMVDVLVGMGEIRALGRGAEGRPWRVALGAADGPAVDLADRAVATSSPAGTRFSPFCHHLFDPASGRSSIWPGSVTVIAGRAAAADALSTALAVLPPARRFAVLDAFGDPTVEVIRL